MNVSTIVTAVFALGIIWGGLVFFLTKAVKFEKLKDNDGKN